jgi:glucokinase
MLYAVCDLGGTTTQVALIDQRGVIKLDARRSTPHKSFTAIVSVVVDLVEELLAAAGKTNSDLNGFGVGVAGLVDYKTGTVSFAPNLPLRNAPLRKTLAQRLGTRVVVDNDAAAATLGEAGFGAGRGIKNLVMLTIGTGIGGGIIIDGALYRGASGSAGELGHMVIETGGPGCECGGQGCLEAVASGRAIAARARSAVRKSGDGKIVDLTDGDLKNITGEVVQQAALAGDKTAIAVLEETGRLIGAGLVTIVNAFNPEMIILGGGVIEGDKIILKTASSVVKKCGLIPNRNIVKIVPAALGNKAGLYGAFVLISETK